MLAYHSKQKLWKTKVKLKQEDEILQSICTGVPELSWSSISKRFKEVSGVSRSAKQCRDRWANYIMNKINVEPWKPEEIQKVFNYHKFYGNHWNLISAELKSRTETQVKNLFYSTIRRNVRKFNKWKKETERIVFKDPKILENEEIRQVLTAEKSKKKEFFMNKCLSNEALSVIKDQFFENIKEEFVKVETLEVDSCICEFEGIYYENADLKNIDEIDPFSCDIFKSQSQISLSILE